TLQRPREKRQRMYRGWPLVRVKVTNPDVVQFEASGFQRAEQLDRARFSLGLKNRIRGQGREARDGLAQIHPRLGDLEPGKLVEQIAPAIRHLELDGIERLFARPSRFLQNLVDSRRPTSRPLQGGTRQSEARQALHALQPVDR